MCGSYWKNPRTQEVQLAGRGPIQGESFRFFLFERVLPFQWKVLTLG